MRQTWRWFGPADKIDVADLPQAGVEGVVSALHHIPPGDVWSRDEARTFSLPNRFTPNRFAFESRPFFVLPAPFLCAICFNSYF